MDRLLEATARAERNHFWFRGFRRFVAPFVAAATRGIAQPRILDCGCGTGHNLQLLRGYGHAVGIDLTRSGLDYARRRGDRLLAQASAAALPFRSGSFDLETSFDVLYALDDETERQALTEIYRVLKPGGQTLVNVAAMKFLSGNHSVLSSERRRYDRRDLGARLERAGFTVLRMTYTNLTLLPVVAGVRFAQRLSGHRESSAEITLPPRPVNALFAAALAAESLALRAVNMPAGSSLLALARKPAD
jgi:SAM-dependent methyltransferase